MKVRAKTDRGGSTYLDISEISSEGIADLPSYSIADAGKVLAVNGAGTAYELVVGGGGGSAPSGPGLYYIDSGDTAHALPLLANNVSDVYPEIIEVGTSTSVAVTGSNFTGGTTLDFSAGVTVDTPSFSSPTSATVSVTATTSGTKTVSANVHGDAGGATFDIIAAAGVFLPGDGTTTWDNQVNVTVGNRTIGKSGGAAAWDAGATFGSVANGEDYVFSWQINTESAEKLIAGMTETYVDENWTDIQYGLYFGSGALTINAIENGSVGAALGAYATGDVMEIRRVGTTVTAYKNDVLIHTFADASSEASLIAEFSINSIVSDVAEKVSLRHD